MQHFSLASLLLHLLGMKFHLEDYTGFNNVAQQRTSLLDWDNNSDSDESDSKPKAKSERTAAAEAETEARFDEMTKIFERKKMSVVRSLIGCLSKKNTENFEKSLNANTVLQELVENETTFKLLVNEGHLELIVNICCQGNANKMNAPYIKHLLGNIIAQYSLRTRNFFDVKLTDFKSTFGEFFADLVFSQCLTLRQADLADDNSTQYENQSKTLIRKIGLDRIRSMELLKRVFAAMNTHWPSANAQNSANAQGDNDELHQVVPSKPLLSTILRKHVTDTVLYMLKAFPFCSISHQQGIEIMKSLGEFYDQEDLATLKAFIRVELDRQARFTYPTTGNSTSGMNMGQIIQIAMRIRNLTQQEIDEASSDDEPDEISMEAVGKRTELFEWMRFCKEKVDPIDKVWNRRLEDPPSEQSDSDEEPPTIIEQER